MKTKTIKFIFIVSFIGIAVFLNFWNLYAQQVNGTVCANVSPGTPQIPRNGVVKALIIFFKYRDDDFNLPPWTDDWPSDYGDGLLRPPWTENILAPSTSVEPSDTSLSG